MHREDDAALGAIREKVKKFSLQFPRAGNRIDHMPTAHHKRIAHLKKSDR